MNKIKFNIVFVFLLVIILLTPLANAEKIFEVKEGDLVKVKINVSDPDGDTISTKFNYPLNEKGEWQTKLGDAGDYPTQVVIGDGKENVTQEIKIIVNKLNIPEINLTHKIKEGERLEIYFPEYSYSQEGSEEDGKEKVEYKFDNLPGGMYFTNNKLIWSPPYTTVKINLNPIERWGYQLGILPRINLEREVKFDIPFEITINNQTVIKKIKIRVINNNREPSIVYLPEKLEASEGEKLNIPYQVDDLDEDMLFVSFSGIVSSNNEEVDYDRQGDGVVNVVVSDGEKSVRKDINVHVNNVNRPPKYTGVNSFNLREGENITYELKFKDPDGDYVIFSLGQDDGNYATLDNQTLTLSPGFDTVRSLQKSVDNGITLGLDDSKEKVEQNISVEVQNVNRKINISSFEPEQKFIIKRGEVVHFKIGTFDPDGDNITYYWEGQEGGDKSDHYRQMIKPGVRTFKVWVSDGNSWDSVEWKFLVK